MSIRSRFHRIARPCAVCFLPLFLLIACAAPAAERGEPGYQHEYDLESGLVLRYETVTSMSMTMDNPMTGSEPFEMSMPITFRIEITGREGDSYTGVMGIDDFAMEGLESMLGAMGESLDLRDMEFAFTLDSDGHSTMNFPLPGLEMTGGMATSQGLAQYFIPWPAHPIEAGATWVDSTTQDAESGADSPFDMTMSLVNHYTYRGLLDDEEGVPPAHVVHAEVSGSLAGGGTAEEMDIEVALDGSWTGETTYRFDPRSGLLESSTGTVTMDMYMEIVSMGVSMPMMSTMTVTCRRLR